MDNTMLYNFMVNYFADHNLPMDEITLIGIRDSKDQDKDVINDQLGFITKDELFLCKGTTEPSVYWAKSGERNPSGTFHLNEGFHEAIWCIGIHKGYEALTNSYPYCKPTKGWRDVEYNFTKDAKDIQVCDYFGINFHRMSENVIVKLIGRMSAGCQVVQNNKDFRHIIDTIKSTQMYLGTTKKTVFNYMLFTIDQIPKECLI